MRLCDLVTCVRLSEYFFFVITASKSCSLCSVTMRVIRLDGRVRNVLWKTIQIFHFLIALGFSCFGVAEFVSNPPFFDGYGDAKVSQQQLPKGLFQNDPRVTDKAAYFAVSFWLKFQGLSWLLTGSMIVNLIFFFLVNYWDEEAFLWKYYTSRNSGLDLQVLSLTLSVTLLFMVIFYTRRKMPFKLKSSLTIQPFGKAHLAWNFIVIFMVTFTCLLLWFSKLYISWACFNSQREIMHLCEKTNMVQCYFCEECNFDAFKLCAENDNYESFHCQSPRNLTRQKAFCIFNYNVSTYTFLTVFGYVGGLCVFLGTFVQILIHYLMRFLLAVCTFLEKKQRSCNATSRFETADDVTTDRDEVEGVSTELHHTATGNINPPGSFDVGQDLNDMDDNDMGNILINASIG